MKSKNYSILIINPDVWDARRDIFLHELRRCREVQCHPLALDNHVKKDVLWCDTKVLVIALVRSRQGEPGL